MTTLVAAALSGISTRGRGFQERGSSSDSEDQGRLPREGGMEVGEGAQQLPGQGPHILWGCLSLTSSRDQKNKPSFFLSCYIFHPVLSKFPYVPELSRGNLERNCEWQSSLGDREATQELPPALCTSIAP